MRRIILAGLAVMLLSGAAYGWTHGSAGGGGGGNFLTDNPGTNILTDNGGSNLLEAL